MTQMAENTPAVIDAAIEKLQGLLTSNSISPIPSEELAVINGFPHLYDTLLEIRAAIMSFSSGDLNYPINKKGFLPGAIKALQGSLHHLTWQTKMIASGDFSQRVDFLGDFSHSFNSMVTQLEESKRMLVAANTQLEESNHHILEGIKCASVIQGSILPRSELFNRCFDKDWFAIYKPCDIVSGDLYWLREIDGRILLAVYDCTGHGVPGAIMTMAVNSSLNQIVDTICSDDPAVILKTLNRMLKNTLHLRCGGVSTVDAGLDIILCCLDPKSSTITFAGAGLSLYCLTDDKIAEIKGDRQGIGYSTIDPDYVYKNNIRNLDTRTTYYATTDGFLDAASHKNSFGFGRQRFTNMIEQYAREPLAQQKEVFEQIIDGWSGNKKHRDDITMLGFRL